MKATVITKTILLLLVTIGICSCTKKEQNTSVTQPLVQTGPEKKYLALGDSYTVGQSVPSAESFPIQTQNWLAASGINLTSTEIIATTGWTTFNLMNAINIRNPSADYKVVSLLIGVNDQYQRHDTMGYRASFTALIDKAIQFAGNKAERVFVLSIPDYSVTPFARYSDTVMIRTQIDDFNAINKEVTAQKRSTYLDITPSTREAKIDASLLASDGLHPSGKEYRKWAERLGPMMKTFLE